MSTALGLGTMAAETATDYLKRSGGQMTGPLTWKNGDALPESTTGNYYLVIDAFANGGTTKYISKANIVVGKADAITTAGTTAQFYRGDNSWSNIIKQTANTALGIDTNLKIGTDRKDLNFDITVGSGTGINDGYAGGITWGHDDAAYAGIYY